MSTRNYVVSGAALIQFDRTWSLARQRALNVAVERIPGYDAFNLIVTGDRATQSWMKRLAWVTAFGNRR